LIWLKNHQFYGETPHANAIKGRNMHPMYEDFAHTDITQKIIGASFEVHKFLGNGFQEIIYQRALAIELSRLRLGYAREIEVDIFYKDVAEPIGTRRADFIVENKVLIELKAISLLEDLHIAQTLNYLKVYKLEVGLLINFGGKSLAIKRLAYCRKP